jgi:Trk K+ transport system NAD-binding subunit
MSTERNRSKTSTRTLVTTVTDVLRGIFQQERSNVLIIGVNPRTRLLAAELEASGREAALVDLAAGPSNKSDEDTSVVLHQAGARSAKCLLAATSNNDLNLQLCRLARVRFGIPEVIARLGWSQSITSWAKVTEVKNQRMAWAEVATAVLDGAAPSDAFQRVARASDNYVVTEIELRSPIYANRSPRDLPLLDGELIAIWREDGLVTDLEQVELELGDTLTLLGTAERITAIRERRTSV